MIVWLAQNSSSPTNSRRRNEWEAETFAARNILGGKAYNKASLKVGLIRPV